MPQKVQVIHDFPKPESPRQLLRFIGLVNFYHRFIPQCAEIIRPLHIFLSSTSSKAKTLDWTDALTDAFQKTKDALAVYCRFLLLMHLQILLRMLLM